MTLDEAEQAATRVLSEQWHGQNEIEMAEFVLAVLPVVRAAERMRNAGIACESSAEEEAGRNRGRYSDSCFGVERAVDTMRAQLGGKP